MLTTASLREVITNTVLSKPKYMFGGFVPAEPLPDKLLELLDTGLLKLHRCLQEAANDLPVSLILDANYTSFGD